jgi:calmodulin-lysine N-methyltransferase
MNHQPTAAAAATGFELPASLFASTQPACRPLRILELGAGMSGLCGLAIAYGSATASYSSHTIGEVLITDGNEACVEGIRYQLAWNAQQQQQKQAASFSAASASSASSSTTRISAQVLAWDRNADYSGLGKFDVILAADCLFFRDFHLDLCHVLRSLLQPDTGRAWLLAPTRGGSLHTFASLIDKQEAEPVQGLRVMQQLERYDESIRQQHESFMREEAEAAAAAASADSAVAPSSYSVDLPYPLLLNIQLSSSVAAPSASA